MVSTQPSAVSPGRRLAWEALLPFHRGMKGRIHVEDQLDTLFSKANLDSRERGFATYLVYGVLRYWVALDALIDQASHCGLSKLDKRLGQLLRFGLFQVLWMDQVPAYAAVSQTLALAQELGVSKAGRGVVSAILNQASRGEIVKPEISPETVLPDAWRKRLEKQVGREAVEKLAQAQCQIPPLVLRVNTLQISAEAYLKLLLDTGIEVEADTEAPDLITLTEAGGPIQALPGYAEGLFVVQDPSSYAVSVFLGPQPGESVLEIGAAPGSKTAHMACLMENQGCIVASDRSANRLAKLSENMARLGVSIVDVLAVAGEDLELGAPRFDRVLVDAPCSASGTTGKHPEILLSLRDGDFTRLSEVQHRLLAAGFKALKPGGTLVYSTCSIDSAENDGVVDAFLAQIPTAICTERQLIWPNGRQDGFFMARLTQSPSDENPVH